MSRIEAIIKEVIENGGAVIYDNVALGRVKSGGYEVAKDFVSYKTSNLTDAFEKFDSACFEDELTFRDGQDWRNIK